MNSVDSSSTHHADSASPGRIIRTQKNATTIHSPYLYRMFAQPVNPKLANRFAGRFMRFHSTSMFLLEAFLKIKEIRCIEVIF
ncbi:MAG: hypothetical protein ABSF45_11085 [Terriglobia bacterium]|jgi:hypothetical protein